MSSRLRSSLSRFHGRAGEQAASAVSAFTLIELMVVVALVGVLIAGVFKLMGGAGDASRRSRTIAKLQRLENAIAGFYSAYGTYPPVPRQESPDPLNETEEDRNSYANSDDENEKFAKRCRRAARSQPISYEFPSRSSATMTSDLHTFFENEGHQNVLAVHEMMGSFDLEETDWSKNKLFKYGLLSFLLPRLTVMGEFDANGNMHGGPDEAVFQRAQWTKFNEARMGDYTAQLAKEAVSCVAWLPNLEGIVHGGLTVLGVRLAGGQEESRMYTLNYLGAPFGLRLMTVLDEWDQPFYYYSAPPYQSYRIWSSGPDHKTFPPGFPMEKLSETQRKLVASWIADDIVGFDR